MKAIESYKLMVLFPGNGSCSKIFELLASVNRKEEPTNQKDKTKQHPININIYSERETNRQRQSAK